MRPVLFVCLQADSEAGLVVTLRSRSIVDGRSVSVKSAGKAATSSGSVSLCSISSSR